MGADTSRSRTCQTTCEMLCNGELITSAGQCNWSMIKVLKSKGYDVFAGDRDSFGWLTGRVQKDGMTVSSSTGK